MGDFISDEQMAALEGGANSSPPPDVQNPNSFENYVKSKASGIPASPGFISDEQMAAMEQAARPAPLTGGETFAGGMSDILNKLTFGAGDEITAGGSSVIDALSNLYNGQPANIGQAYDDRLAQTRDLIKRYDAEHPYSSAANNLLAFLAPMPNTRLAAVPESMLPESASWLTKMGAKITPDFLTSTSEAALPKLFAENPTIMQALGNVVKGVGLGAGYGGVGGFLSGEGGFDNRVGSAETGAGYGAALGGGLQALAEGGGQVARAVRAANNYISPESRAGQALLAADPEGKILSMPTTAPANDPFFNTRTLGEQTQDPMIAQLQDLVGKHTPDAGPLIKDNSQARQALQEQIVNSLSTDPIRSQEQGGAALRALVQQGADKAFSDSAGNWKAIDQSGIAPVTNLREEIPSIVSGTYKAGAAPRSLEGIAKEVQTKIPKPFDVTKALTGGDSGPVFQDFSYLHDLRQRVNDSWRMLKAEGDNTGMGVASQMRTVIDKAIAEAPGSAPNALTPADVALFNKGKESFSSAMDIYDKGNLGAALNQAKQGQYYVKASDAVGKFFDGSPEGTRQLIQALPNTPEALATARGAIRDMITSPDTKLMTNDGNFKPEAFRTWLRQNADGLTAEHNGVRLFTPRHVEDLQKVADDLGNLSPQSRTSIKGLATIASKGQSTTAQTLITEQLSKFGISKIPVVGKIADAVSTYFEQATNKVLAEAMIRDKSFAAELVSKAKSANIPGDSSLSTGLQSLLGSLLRSAVAAQPPRSSPQSQKGIAETQSQRKLSITNKVDRAVGASPNPTPTPVSNSSNFGAKLNAALDKAYSMADTLAGYPKEALLDAVAKTEWNHKGSGVSDKGAEGPYQLMPAIQKYYGVSDPFNEPASRRAAEALITDEFKALGTPELTLASYNAGRTKVIAAMKRAQSTDWSKVKQYLPTETQKYVSKVQGNIKV